MYIGIYRSQTNSFPKELQWENTKHFCASVEIEIGMRQRHPGIRNRVEEEEELGIHTRAYWFSMMCSPTADDSGIWYKPPRYLELILETLMEIKYEGPQMRETILFSDPWLELAEWRWMWKPPIVLRNKKKCLGRKSTSAPRSSRSLEEQAEWMGRWRKHHSYRHRQKRLDILDDNREYFFEVKIFT
ncbi:hypothetical protein ScPMuIL_006537 [Solemya velum]